jgi:hypothetical protein
MRCPSSRSGLRRIAPISNSHNLTRVTVPYGASCQDYGRSWPRYGSYCQSAHRTEIGYIASFPSKEIEAGPQRGDLQNTDGRNGIFHEDCCHRPDGVNPNRRSDELEG